MNMEEFFVRTTEQCLRAEGEIEKSLFRWTGRDIHLPAQTNFVLAGQTKWIVIDAMDPSVFATPNSVPAMMQKLALAGKDHELIVIDRASDNERVYVSYGKCPEIGIYNSKIWESAGIPIGEEVGTSG